MIDEKIIKAIFSNYSIDEVIFIKESSFCSFIICSMNENISLDRWNNLENILKEYTSNEVSLLSLEQALKYLGNEYISKGVIIK